MAQQRRDGETAARWLGLTVFLLGVFLMFLVFVWAARLFNEIGVGKDLLVQGNPKDRLLLTEWLMRWLVRVGLIFALGYLASLIAARGASFYLAARTPTKGDQERKGEQ